MPILGQAHEARRSKEVPRMNETSGLAPSLPQPELVRA